MPEPSPAPVGSLHTALAHAYRLLDRDPTLAAEQADAILEAVPDQPDALVVKGAAQRRLGDTAASRTTLEAVAAANPAHARARLELGLTLAAGGDAAAARDAITAATGLDPHLTGAWLALGDQLRLSGDRAAAEAAYLDHVGHAARDPVLIAAARALGQDRLKDAEGLLREHLTKAPSDVAALRMLAELGMRLNRLGEAETLLARCLDLAPGFAAARYAYALAIYRLGRPADALGELDRLLAAAPTEPSYRNLKAAALGQTGDYETANAIFAGLVAEQPGQPKIWLSYGHTLKTANRLDEGIAAYRRAISLDPGFGEAWWSLANLKTVRFDTADIAAMRAALGRPNLGDDDRLQLDFALGKALEDAGDYGDSFAHYAAGNALRRRRQPYRADEMSERMARQRRVFTPAFFAARAGQGDEAPDPIFVVGLPRSGSTLIEQILASHSQVEGTMELPDLGALARRLNGKPGSESADRYPDIVAELAPADLAALGADYLASTRVQRKTDRPFFIDKMPQNFLHLGLILAILPNAKIIDARRHPLATCFSAYKQHFARGQNFTYDLVDLGRYYCDYVRLTAHFDQIMPGRILRVFYECMVSDTETEIRRLLDYCGLTFEPGCLRFYENDRAVRTASSEQVRRPIYRDGIDQWRHDERWLEPLRQALGPVLDCYPAVPAELA